MNLKKKIITLGSPLLRPAADPYKRSGLKQEMLGKKQFQDFEIRMTVGLAIILLAFMFFEAE